MVDKPTVQIPSVVEPESANPTSQLAGVVQMMVTGASIEGTGKAIELARAHPARLFATAQPESLWKWTPITLEVRLPRVQHFAVTALSELLLTQ